MIPLIRSTPSSLQYIYNRYKTSNVSRINPARFQKLIESYPDRTVFVHIGLSDINSAFPGNPYEFILNILDDNFESIIAPGFTPSFRETGIYDKRESTPEFGKFSELFMKDADRRTNDAIHSFLIRGDYDFSERNHHDTFGENGCFAKLDEDNVLILNIGTANMEATQFHYIEIQNQVPYRTNQAFEGIIIDETGEKSKISQHNFSHGVFKPFLIRNRKRTISDLNEAEKIDNFILNGLNFMAFRAGDLHNVFQEKIEEDPYYLIK